MADDTTLELLRIHLSPCVPLVIHEFLSGRRELVMPRPDLALMIAENGDHILYRGSRTAETVNALVEAIATLSFCPGGVSCFGLHFEVPLEFQQQDADVDLGRLLSFVQNLPVYPLAGKAPVQIQMLLE